MSTPRGHFILRHPAKYIWYNQQLIRSYFEGIDAIANRAHSKFGKILHRIIAPYELTWSRKLLAAVLSVE